MSVIDESLPRSERKHRAILDAAQELFLRDGYLGTSMDELAEQSMVSKQTVYKHFGSKKQLFVELVTSMTAGAGDGFDRIGELPTAASELGPYLERYGIDELKIVLTLRLLRLRRLVIGEVARFPELAEALFENGPQRAIRSLTAVMAELARRGLLEVENPETAATTLNWLLMAAPVNEAMLRGDAAIPSPAAMSSHTAEAVRVFLAAYGS